jgi:hypothetical protein
VVRAHAVPAFAPGRSALGEMLDVLENTWGTLRRRTLPELELEVQKWVEKWLAVRQRSAPVVTVVVAFQDGAKP